MSRLLINQYYKELAKVKQHGQTRNESSISIPFYNLLNQYCNIKGFSLISQLAYQDKNIRPDGTIRDSLGLDWGYWESKDEDDNLDQQIEKKFAKGYPNDNILFEDSQTAILIQAGREVMRISMKDSDALDKILKQFIDYQRPEVAEFYQAIDKFKSDLPTIIITLRDKIDQASCNNQKFINKRDNFLQVCKDSINPNITTEDIREMMIQHILTEDIFLTIFDEAQFHRENNVARELTELINTFLKGTARKQLLTTIQHYYAVIKRKASQISNHHDKQRFLKSVYENFYKAYNPKSADRLGIVYTPNEIVKFMVESVDYLCYQHFGKFLEDQGVEILDPATGTGTFITEIIEYLHPDKLKYKYQNEIHCNEVSILPYYIANLNIEATYFQKMGEYVEFENICFVDTLDHTAFHLKQMDLFAMSVENTARIFRQNDRELSVIIGNPPYNANQQNENDNNKNREYPAIDKRIKDTYIKASNAQKTKLYDMYCRFFRWATDRLGKNGILAFITNSSFINAKGFDGFRKLVAEEFSSIYIIDLGGDIRSGDQSGSVFNIMIGVAISFMIKKEPNSNTPCQIFYTSLTNCQNAQEKLEFLSQVNFDKINFNHIIPSNKYDWINQANNDFEQFIPVANKTTKFGNTVSDETAIFKLFYLGVSTNRDEWVVDRVIENLSNKMELFITRYKEFCFKDKNLDDSLKWSRDLKSKLEKRVSEDFNPNLIIKYYYRVFTKLYLYASSVFVDRLGLLQPIFCDNQPNKVIIFSFGKRGNFSVLSTDKIFSLDIFLPDATQSLPLYRYDDNGNRIENITDWGLQQFREYYKSINLPLTPAFKGGENKNKKAPLSQDKYQQKALLTKGGLRGDQITKEDIFYYVYAVLHNPEYRQKYELNLKREFPRIPFYDDFFKWVNWGKQLMELHLNYETIDPYPLEIINVTLTPNPSPTGEGKKAIKPKLKADKIKGEIILDELTILTGIPSIAWEYKLGNRSALEWILDQDKEKKPKDPTIAERFNNYRFADYKDQVIDLLMRVTTVSVETMKIINQFAPP
jgi:predicted helicase